MGSDNKKAKKFKSIASTSHPNSEDKETVGGAGFLSRVQSCMPVTPPLGNTGVLCGPREMVGETRLDTIFSPASVECYWHSRNSSAGRASYFGTKTVANFLRVEFVRLAPYSPAVSNPTSKAVENQ